MATAGGFAYIGKCKIHHQVITLFCETCNQCICEKCSSFLHKEHGKMSMTSAKEKHKSILSRTRIQMEDKRTIHQQYLDDIQQAVIHAGKQNHEGLLKVEKQEEIWWMPPPSSPPPSHSPPVNLTQIIHTLCTTNVLI